MTSDYIEAWQPKIGDLVRIRMSLECPCKYAHPIEFDGRTGVVSGDFEVYAERNGPLPEDLIRDYRDSGHRWFVDVDGEPVVVNNGVRDRYIGRGSFAVAELEPLQAAPPPPAEGEFDAALRSADGGGSHE